MHGFLSWLHRVQKSITAPLSWCYHRVVPSSPRKVFPPYVPPQYHLTEAEENAPLPHPVAITLPWTTIFRGILGVGIAWVLFGVFAQVQSVVITLCIVLFLSLGLSPVISSMERHMPRWVAILLLYVVFLGLLVLVFSAMIPIVAEQLITIASQVRTLTQGTAIEEYPLVQQILSTLHIDPSQLESLLADNLTMLGGQLRTVVSGSLSVASGVFSGLVSFFFALVLLFFILLEREQVGEFFLLLVPRKDRHFIAYKVTEVQWKMAQWFEAQLLLMLSIAVLMGIGLLVIRLFFPIPYIFTIALFAGFMELFPYIGLLLTGVFAGLVALNVSWVAALITILWMMAAQALEGNIIVPVIMERVVGLSALVTLLSLSIAALIGNALGGVPLAVVFIILSVPLATTIKIFLREYMEQQSTTPPLNNTHVQ